MRVASVIRLRPEQAQKYRDLHRAVWPEVLAALTRAKDYAGRLDLYNGEFVEHGGIAREHGPVAPILQSLDFVDCCVVFRHVVQPDRSRPQSKSDRHPGDNGNKCLGGCHSSPEAGVV